jgi:hypothetical protein
MPTWGPMFDYLDNHNQGSAQQRIRNLCDYLATVQAGSALPWKLFTFIPAGVKGPA